ncbi:hypothetical protein F4775DRAFT_277900 [Biscogniauxia sp. FL1348]|nr:hypothetical protein F4775DRAFT_277900 [Biscogniauxia sp. FL1348]
MDFVGDEMGLLYQGGRSGVKTDPIEFFVKMLSLSPNSRIMFAEKLLLFAGETPGGMRTALSPALSSHTTSSSGNESASWNGGGAVVGEVTDEGEVDEVLGAMNLRNGPFAGDAHAAPKHIHAPPTTTNTTITTTPADLRGAVFRTDADINAGMGLGAGLTPSYSMPNDAGLGSFSAPSDAGTADWSNYAYSSSVLTPGHSGSTISISDTGAKSVPFGAFAGGGNAGMITQQQQQQQQQGYTDGKGGDEHRAMPARFPTGGILGV